MLPGFSSRGHKILKKLFEGFQDSYSAWPSLISEWNDLSNSGSLFCLDASNKISAQEDVWFRRYCLKYGRQVPWRHSTIVLPAVNLQSPV